MILSDELPSISASNSGIVGWLSPEVIWKRILKREYTAEFREQAVAMVNSGRSVPGGAKTTQYALQASLVYNFTNPGRQAVVFARIGQIGTARTGGEGCTSQAASR